MRVELDHDDLRPLIAEVITETLATLARDAGRVAYPEKEAAALLGMAPHQLRDRRMEGLIRGKKVGRSYFYTRRELERLMK